MMDLQYLAEKRAVAMAYVALTDRADLDVRVPTPADGPFDGVVHLTGRRRKGERTFAVKVTGMPEASTPADADRHSTAMMRALVKAGPYPIPAVVLLFTLRGNGGYFTWVSEPADGGELVLHSKPAFRPFDPAALDEVVKAVDAWYDRRYAAVLSAAAS